MKVLLLKILLRTLPTASSPGAHNKGRNLSTRRHTTLKYYIKHIEIMVFCVAIPSYRQILTFPCNMMPPFAVLKVKREDGARMLIRNGSNQR
jgi:hypothetical protein